jgi:co-chaperonin GroES (HSP10)
MSKLIPMRDRLVLKELPRDMTPGGLHIVQSEKKSTREAVEEAAHAAIRCVVVAQGVGMLKGETGCEFEIPFPRKVPVPPIHPSDEHPDGVGGYIENWNLVGRTVTVSYYAGFVDTDPITGEKHIIATPLDILAVVEEGTVTTEGKDDEGRP